MANTDSMRLLDDPSLLSQHTEECSLNELLELWRQFEENVGSNTLISVSQQRYWSLLSPEKRGALLLELTEEEQRAVLYHALSANQETRREELIEALVALEPDERVDILQHVQPERCFTLLRLLPEKEQRETKFLLPFRETQAAGIMTTRYSTLRADMKVSEALSLIRSSQEMAELEVFYYHYIIDEQGMLLGVISLKKLLLAADQQLLAQVMNSDFYYVESHAEQEEVIELLEERDLLAVPVVDSRKHLLGLVTFDDVMDLIRQEQAQNISNLGGVSGQRADLMDNFLQAPIGYLLTQRLPWLVLLLIMGTLTSNLLQHFQSFIAAVPVLTLFIPLITQTGGNVGSQSSVLIIRSISAHNLSFRNLFAVLGKEFLVALVLGIIMGSLVFLRNDIFLQDLSWLRNLAVSLSLGAVVLFAALIGIFIPLLLSLVQINPTVASGPLIATLLDVLGLGIYFLIMGAFSDKFDI